MKFTLYFFAIVAFTQCSPKLAPDAGWGRDRWVVVEMKGVPVQQSGSRRDAYISFQVDEKKFNGNGGCNQISGNYTIDKKALHFGEVRSTKMSCPDLAFETTFLETLGRVERYEMNGNDLLLKRNRETLLIMRAK